MFLHDIHMAKIGPTRVGKTYSAITEAKKKGQPVIYINPQDEEMPGFVRVDGNVEFSFVSRLLHNGMMVNYVPQRNWKLAMKELDKLVEKVFDFGNITIIMDEVSIHGYEGLHESPWIDVAERGGKFGVWGIFLMQDPAGVSKRILRNCRQFHIFECNEYTMPYFEKLKYDTVEMQKLLLNAPNYSYIIIERREIKGIGRE